MSDTTRTKFDDIALGADVIIYGTAMLGLAAALAVASACSTVVGTVIVGILASVIFTLTGAAAGGYIFWKMDGDKVAKIGAATHSVAFKLGGLFARKTPAPVVAA